MNDKERFLFLLKNKEKYKVFIDNDDVYFVDKKDLEHLLQLAYEHASDSIESDRND